jgi:hypothetical protein
VVLAWITGTYIVALSFNVSLYLCPFFRAGPLHVKDITLKDRWVYSKQLGFDEGSLHVKDITLKDRLIDRLFLCTFFPLIFFAMFFLMGAVGAWINLPKPGAPEDIDSELFKSHTPSWATSSHPLGVGLLFGLCVYAAFFAFIFFWRVYEDFSRTSIGQKAEQLGAAIAIFVGNAIVLFLIVWLMQSCGHSPIIQSPH